jgi:hypothetical protein
MSEHHIVTVLSHIDADIDVDVDLDDLIEAMDDDEKHYVATKLARPQMDEVQHAGEAVYYEFVNRQPEITPALRELVWRTAGRIL